MSSGVLDRADFLARAQAVIQRRTGLAFSAARQPDLKRGLEAALTRAGGPDADAYLERLDDGDPHALDDLVAEITVGETYFFREPDQFAVISEQVLPELLAQCGDARPLRLWSAGCASGEEPYSLAILLKELGHDGAAHVLGTDISRAALARARRGRYPRWSFRGVAEDRIQTHFTRGGRDFALDPAIRGAVGFGYLNLAEDTYPSLATGVWGMDLILCRNVLIYFDAETVARVARRLLDSLAAGGWLLLGASDPLLGHLVPCEVVVTRAGLAYRRAKTGDGGGWGTMEGDAHPPPRSWPHAADEHGRAQGSTDQPERARTSPDEHRRAPTGGDSNEDPAREAAMLVRALANQGDLDAAGRACAAALDRHQTSPELTYLHAVLLAEGGHPAESADAARQAIYLDRHLAVAHLALGAALGKLGDATGARRSFRNAAQLLAALPPDAPVPAADGEPAARLAEMVRLQQQLLGEKQPS